ncbi:hypothetical protein KM043_017549 [Ampulex compressa]|nr:hypothetical protein KM043_017549 [Ampulex compressa]
MAKNDDLIIHRPNTVQENARVLHNLQRKEQEKSENTEDLDELFARLNRDNIVKPNKDKEYQNSSWYSKNIVNYAYGPITGFPPGSWWGIRMDCSRDRVHDPFDEDIQDGPFGATSVCTSSTNIKEDVDFGDFLTLTGQIYLHGQYTREPLVQNYQQLTPLRLIRSYNRLNEFAPKTGYRYDGLYLVIGSWIGISLDTTKYHKFALKRIFGQELAPWSGKRGLLETETSHSILHATSTSSIITEHASLGVSEFKRYSNDVGIPCGWKKCNIGKESVNLPDITGTYEKQKPPNSAIVTRHVFKKVNPNTENTMMLGTPHLIDDKTPSQFGNQTSKAHSTNISIRTGLYDSSPIVQQETRKGTSLSICRSLKPINIFKSNIQIESLYSLNKEKGKVDGMIDISKGVKLQQVDSMANCSQTKTIVRGNASFVTHVDNMKKRTNSTSQSDTSMHMRYYTSNMHNATNSSLGRKSIFQVVNKNVQGCKSISMCTRKIQPFSQCQHELNNIKEVNKMNSITKERFNDTANLSETSTKKLKLNSTLQESIMKHKIVPEEQKTLMNNTEFISYPQSLKSLESLESLTPDKILNLINEEKYHPLSKLLMGNIIGLTSEDTLALRTKSTSSVQLEKRDIDAPQKSNVDESSKKKNFIAVSEDSVTGRRYKFRRRKKFKDTMRKMLKRSDVSITSRHDTGISTPSCKNINEQFDVSEQNSSVTNISTMKEQLQCNNDSNKLTLNIQQDIENGIDISTQFETVQNISSSKHFIKDNIKKHIHKKQSREIANLLIDAKIEPKMRGPRNRRLRCISNIHTREQPYEPFSTVICTSNKCKINMVMGKERSDFKKKRKLLKSKKQKTIVETQAMNEAHSETLRTTKNNDRQNFDIYTVRHYKKVINTDHRRVESFKKENDNDNNNKSKSVMSRKDRLIQRVPATVKYGTVVKHVCHEQEEFIKPSMTDAITQCSLLSEESIHRTMPRDIMNTMYDSNCVPIKHHVDRRTCVKAELNDVEHLKFESLDSAMYDETYEDQRSHRDSPTSICRKICGGDKYCMKYPEIQDASQRSGTHQVSAFVAVNISNSDLKIARLRSIGFKPITSHPLWTADGHSPTTGGQNSKKCTTIHQSKVVKQDVAEKYNKYTNEDNSVVVYMDEELQYQDIENEDMGQSSKKMIKAHVESTIRNEELKEDHLSKELYHGLSLEQEAESPWHGWKKVETTENTYWIGWYNTGVCPNVTSHKLIFTMNPTY